MLNKINILGAGITNESEKKILEEVLNLLQKGRKFTIATPNPEILVYAKKHKPYQNILNSAEISLPDGVGLLMAAKLQGKPLKSRVTGVDFIENLCKFTEEKPVSMGFLGGRPNVAEGAVECLKKKYPWIKVVFVGSEWNESYLGQAADRRVNSGNQESRMPNKSNRTYRTHGSDAPSEQIDILFVAFGAPKQEEWIASNLERLPVTAAMGVGGAFDYLSGKVVRAPKAVRSMGLEWLFRLIRQPWRWKRQLALFEFVVLILKDTFSKH